MSFKTPVLFISFNRMEPVQRVFEQIRRLKPEKLFLASDGPRSDCFDYDKRAIDLVRSYQDAQIDWNCEVHRLYRENNLGCKNAVSSAISWVFEQTETSIILEDDCLPDFSFFKFCEELLERYKDHSEIKTIAGINLVASELKISSQHSYFFSKTPQIWGWATWKRVWREYDFEMKHWPENRELLRKTLNMPQKLFEFYTDGFDDVKFGGLDTWDSQLVYSIWVKNGLTIQPSSNLVRNIGFGKDATHTKNENIFLANLKTNPLVFPLIHPLGVKRDTEMEGLFARIMFPTLCKRIMKKIKYFLKAIIKF